LRDVQLRAPLLKLLVVLLYTKLLFTNALREPRSVSLVRRKQQRNPQRNDDAASAPPSRRHGASDFDGNPEDLSIRQ